MTTETTYIVFQGTGLVLHRGTRIHFPNYNEAIERAKSLVLDGTDNHPVHIAKVVTTVRREVRVMKI